MKHFVLIAAAATMTLTTTTADAEFKRSCDARMFIELKALNGHPVGTRTLERFEATATCPWRQTGRNKDRCREKAVGIAFKCMQASWDERWNRKTPNECFVSRGVYSYGMPNIKCDIFDRICSEVAEQGRPSSWPAAAIVRGQTSGHTNSCVVTNHPFGDYTIKNCSAAERAEHCGSN